LTDAQRGRLVRLENYHNEYQLNFTIISECN